MITLIRTLAAVAAGAVLATNAFAQNTREVREVSPSLWALRAVINGRGDELIEVAKSNLLR